MSSAEFKIRFSEVVELLKSGETIAITYGKKKEIVGYFSSNAPQRKLGIMEGKVKVTFAPDFKMTTEEFLGLGDSTPPPAAP